MKMLTSEQVNGMLERSHDYSDLLKNVKYFDLIISNFYLHPERIDGKLNEHETRKRYSEKTKMEMREHFLLTQKYAETARTFNANESTLRNIVKTPKRKAKLSDKGNQPGAGRPLTYPLEVENDLICWILQLRDLHVPVSVLALQEKAKIVVRPHNPKFNASRGWVDKFFARPRLSLRCRTSVSQKLPQQLEASITKFYADAGRFMRIGKYPRSLVANMDETPAFFDMVPNKSICKTGTRECVVRTSGGEKKHVTIVLSASADGNMLPPMLIFKGKQRKRLKNCVYPKASWLRPKLKREWTNL